MSKYTTELRYVCERLAGLTESSDDVEAVIASARTKVFDFPYPIYDEDYRSTLELKILRHFYFREIGFETVGLWKHYLNTKLNEIMPYYNQLYKSTLLEFNPLYDVDLTTDRKNTENSNRDFKKNTTSKDVTQATTQTHNQVQNENTNWNYFSDTPQGGIDGVASLAYLTTATKVSDDGSTTTNLSGLDNSTVDRTGTDSDNTVYNSTLDYLEHVSGKTGGSSYSARLLEYRDTFINIDSLILNELSELFINLW